jgi:hypothetical protein
MNVGDLAICEKRTGWREVSFSGKQPLVRHAFLSSAVSHLRFRISRGKRRPTLFASDSKTSTEHQRESVRRADQRTVLAAIAHTVARTEVTFVGVFSGCNRASVFAY